MLSKRSIPVLMVLLLTGSLIAFNSKGLNNPPDKYAVIFREVTEMLEQAHFNPKR